MIMVNINGRLIDETTIFTKDDLPQLKQLLKIAHKAQSEYKLKKEDYFTTILEFNVKALENKLTPDDCKEINRKFDTATQVNMIVQNATKYLKTDSELARQEISKLKKLDFGLNENIDEFEFNEMAEYYLGLGDFELGQHLEEYPSLIEKDTIIPYKNLKKFCEK